MYFPDKKYTFYRATEITAKYPLSHGKPRHGPFCAYVMPKNFTECYIDRRRVGQGAIIQPGYMTIRETEKGRLNRVTGFFYKRDLKNL